MRIVARLMKEIRTNNVLVVAAAGFIAVVLAPQITMALYGEAGMELHELGDFVGGTANYLASIVTILVLVYVFVAERTDDRRAAFDDGLMILLKMHIDERTHVLSRKVDGSYFKWLWTNNIDNVLAASDHEKRRNQINDVFEDRYAEIASWYLSVMRVVSYISSSGENQESKTRAMKMFRLTCEREEQRALLLLLFMKDAKSPTSKYLFEHDFFLFAQLAKDSRLAQLKSEVPAEWLNSRPSR